MSKCYGVEFQSRRGDNKLAKQLSEMSLYSESEGHHCYGDLASVIADLRNRVQVLEARQLDELAKGLENSGVYNGSSREDTQR